MAVFLCINEEETAYTIDHEKENKLDMASAAPIGYNVF